MIRISTAIVLFLLLFTLQTSFIHALPGILGIIPLFFAVSVYFIQHHSLVLGGAWLVSYGIFLDLFHIPAVPFESLSYGIAAVIALIISKRVFSNRSLYGVLGCGVVSFLSLIATHSIILFFVHLQTPERVIWEAFFNETAWTSVELILLLILLFQFAGGFRTLLIRSFLLSSKHETF